MILFEILAIRGVSQAKGVGYLGSLTGIIANSGYCFTNSKNLFPIR